MPTTTNPESPLGHRTSKPPLASSNNVQTKLYFVSVGSDNLLPPSQYCPTRHMKDSYNMHLDEIM